MSTDLTLPQSASFWIERTEDADRLLIDEKAIQSKNQLFYNTSGIGMNDLKRAPQTHNATARKQELVDAMISDVSVILVSGDRLYKNGTAMDRDAITDWTDRMKQGILESRTGTSAKKRYGICTKRAELRLAPDAAFIGLSEEDRSDRFVHTALNINDPLILEAVTADGRFFYGVSGVSSGWVEADHVAVCDDRDEWLARWDLSGDRFLVILANDVIPEGEDGKPLSSGLKLMLGTRLPLAAPGRHENSAERDGYEVLLPARDGDGKLVCLSAWIRPEKRVHIGHVPMTKKNILTIAFNCIGDPYGWGGSQGAMDCSLYMMLLYRCFGLEIPRNTGFQCKMPVHRVDLAQMEEAERMSCLRELPAGTLLIMPGHVVLYLGELDGEYYVINDVSELVPEERIIGKKIRTESVYRVTVNSVRVRRKNGRTWLNEFDTAVIPWEDRTEVT